MSSATEPRRLLAAAAACLLAACSESGGGDDGADPLCREPVGDLGAPIEMEILDWRSGDPVALDSGADVELLAPPQGGFILAVGPRVRNVRAGFVTLTAWLEDADTGALYGLEERPSEIAAGPDGWAAPARPDSLSSYSNIPACPIPDLPRDIDDQPWMLGMRVTDCEGRRGEHRITVFPRCSDATCECFCSQDHVLGSPCATDGGPADASARLAP
jgi:hypothetical protein